MTDLPITIREFRYPEDYEQAAHLWRSMEKGVRFSRSDVPVELEKKMKRDPDLFLVAEADGELVATVIGGFDGRRGMIYHLAVAESRRGRGLASQLMDELEKRLIAKGCIRSYLLVHADNTEAFALYEKRGWAALTDIVLYAKDLRA
jgi:ribosomal protein S18 acetylase RimI-like enzyme